MTYKTEENTCTEQTLTFAFTEGNQSPCSLYSSPPALPAGRREEGFVVVSCTVFSLAAFAQLGSGLSPAAPPCAGQFCPVLTAGCIKEAQVPPFGKKYKLVYSSSIN